MIDGYILELESIGFRKKEKKHKRILNQFNVEYVEFYHNNRGGLIPSFQRRLFYTPLRMAVLFLNLTYVRVAFFEKELIDKVENWREIYNLLDKNDE